MYGRSAPPGRSHLQDEARPSRDGPAVTSRTYNSTSSATLMFSPVNVYLTRLGPNREPVLICGATCPHKEPWWHAVTGFCV
jgi:hypothetical protein